MRSRTHLMNRLATGLRSTVAANRPSAGAAGPGSSHWLRKGQRIVTPVERRFVSPALLGEWGGSRPGLQRLRGQLWDREWRVDGGREHSVVLGNFAGPRRRNHTECDGALRGALHDDMVLAAHGVEPDFAGLVGQERPVEERSGGPLCGALLARIDGHLDCAAGLPSNLEVLGAIRPSYVDVVRQYSVVLARRVGEQVPA